eukprot:s2868_g5.t1
MENKKDSDGTSRPGHSIWCVRGRRLLKCSAEQLRPASPREEILEVLASEEGETPPWTFPRIVDELGGNEYEDISKEVPSEESWQKAQDPVEVSQPSRRHTTKRPVGPHDGEPSLQRTRTATTAYTDLGETTAECWWNLLSDQSFEQACGQSFWADNLSTVEIKIPMPESRRGTKAFVNNVEAYFVGAVRRGAVEVNRKLDPEEYRQFQEAKSVEVKNFVAAKAFEALPPELQPDKSQAIGMRWILTWKLKDDGSHKAKARAILQGYQDPQYEHRATTTPVMTRMMRQFLLPHAANHQWRVKKGDVTGAFLQGRQYSGKLHCIPVPEISEAMGLTPGEAVLVKRGCYGLVDAPLEWYRSISQTLEELGLTKSWSDPCCWFYKPDGKLRGIVAGHVDDFLFSGDANDKQWVAIEQELQRRYKWTGWEEGKFVQCGVTIEAQKDGSFKLSQPNFIDKVSEINLSSSRRRDSNILQLRERRRA